MASAPRFKVYRDGIYIAATKYIEDAAAIIASTSSGEIRDGHRKVVWMEGKEEIHAGESYDRVAEIVKTRI